MISFRSNWVDFSCVIPIEESSNGDLEKSTGFLRSDILTFFFVVLFSVLDIVRFP